uniref:Ubiquitin-like protease family profile domain-containing protein n=1 Tax=Panagrolaimus davidi TaxID=227884 RepID=A0A914P557_9BILA
MHRKWNSSKLKDQQHQEPGDEQHHQLNLITDGPSVSYSNTNTVGVGDRHVAPGPAGPPQGINEQPQFYGSAPSTSTDPRYQVVEPKKPKNYNAGLNTRPTTPISLHIQVFEDRRRNPGEHDVHNKLLNAINQLDFTTPRNYIDEFIFPRSQWKNMPPSDTAYFHATQRLLKFIPEFPRSESNENRPSDIANFKSSQRLDRSSVQQPLQNPHHDDATVNQNADQDVEMVDLNADLDVAIVEQNSEVVVDQNDNDSDQQSDGEKPAKRRRKTRKSQATKIKEKRAAVKLKNKSQCSAYSAGILSSATTGQQLKSQQLTQQQLRKLPKSRRPPTTAQNRAEALKPKRPNQGFQVIADVTIAPKVVQDSVTESSQMDTQSQQPNINANGDSNRPSSTQIHQPIQDPTVQLNEDNPIDVDDDGVIVIDDVDYLGGSESISDVPSFQGTTLKDPNLYNALNLQPNSWASDMHIQAFHAAYIPHLSGHVFRRIAFLDSQWQQYPDTPIPNFLRMFPRNPDLIQCPLHLYADHWGLLSINVGQDVATWYDPLMQSWDTQMERVELDYCETILNSLKREGVINDETILQVADYESFNQQRDGCSCGWHICIISEDIARDGHSTRWSRLQIIEERKRMYSILHRLHNINSLPTTLQPQTLPTWPELPHREYDADVVLSLTPQPRWENDGQTIFTSTP